MGLRLFLRSASSYDKPYKPVGAPRNAGTDDHELARSLYEQLPNPNPSRYRIIKHKALGGNLLVKIKYLDCTNYEGNKILLYKNTTLKQLKKQKYIDPHFSKSKKFRSPFARFEPTKSGWLAGLYMLGRI
jgi:hypothetical protein